MPESADFEAMSIAEYTHSPGALPQFASTRCAQTRSLPTQRGWAAPVRRYASGMKSAVVILALLFGWPQGVGAEISYPDPELKARAEAGDVEAQEQLGISCLITCPAEARRWLPKAAEQGLPQPNRNPDSGEWRPPSQRSRHGGAFPIRGQFDR